MKFKKIVVLFTLICLLPVIPFAEASDDENGSTAVTMTFEASAGESCTLRVLNEGLTSVTSIDDIYFMDEAVISPEGSVSFEIAGECTGYYYIAKSSSGEELTGYLSSGRRTSDNNAYYVLDEDFGMLNPNPSTDTLDILDWGWDVLEESGSIEYGSYLSLTDSSSSGRYLIRRTFEELSSSKAYAEFRLTFKDLSDGYGVSLNSGDTECVKLEINNSALFAGKKLLCPLVADTEYGIRIEMDMDFGVYDVYVNGSKKAAGLRLYTNAVDNIRAFTSVSGTGTMNFGPVRIMRGYYAADEFVGYQKNQYLPEEGLWDTDSGGGSVRLVSSAGTPGPDLYSVQLADTSPSGSVGMSRNFETLTGAEVFTFKAYSAEDINNLEINFGDCAARISGGVFYAMAKDGTEQAVKSDIAAGLWNTYRITADFAAGTAVIQINGKEAEKNFVFADSGASAGGISFKTGAAQTDTLWLDDIYVFADTPVDEYYPSEPAKLEKDFTKDVMVGIQTCDLWREGKHFGWDKINGYAQRKPYLGFYDDGSPEVKDWEIKYMVEHGIDYSIHCWYRPGSAGAPIKEPRNGYSIHDGYFNAKYKDKIKFAIAWENAGYSASSADAAISDFKNNILPFWIEYYFKDPNYLVVDNKIVLNIYNAPKLVSAFGDDGVTEIITYLEQQVKTLGFDGVYLIGTTASSNAAALQTYADYGYDAIYCYSYGQTRYSVYKQKQYIKAQKEQTTISYIPTITMGRDDTAWNRTPGGYISAEAVEEICRWVKDTYFSNGIGTELGDRMITIDNWNEYGEGHFFMPTSLNGFGYLEAVGSVFGQPEHTDVKPRDVSRLGHLYDQSRSLGVKKEEEARYLLSRWDTYAELCELEKESGSLKWQSFEVSSDGILSATTGIFNNDPKFRTPDNLDIPIRGDEVIHMRMKHNVSDANAQIYFTTTSDTTETEVKSVKAAADANSSDYVDLYFDMSSNQYWTGTLKRLRFDPFNGKGTFEVDLIELYRDTETFSEPEFTIRFAGFKKTDGTDIADIPAEETEVMAVLNYANPYADMSCIAMAAEYNAEELTGLYMAEDTAIKTGTGALKIPMTFRPDRTYSMLVWDALNRMSPLMQAEKNIISANK